LMPDTATANWMDVPSARARLSRTAPVRIRNSNRRPHSSPR
jgi:hypothetical protein